MSVVSQLPASAKRLYHDTSREWDENEARATACWIVDYADADRFAQVCGGLAEPSGWGLRIVPLLFPDTDAIAMYAYYAKGKCTGRPSDVAPYSHVKFEVGFKTFRYDFDGTLAFVEESYKPGAEIITLPGSAFKFPSDNKRVNQEVGLLIPGTEFNLKFHRVASLDLSLYQSLEGRVNSTTFVPSYYNVPAGQIQYLGAEAGVTTTVAGVRSYEVTHNFRYRRIPINEILRPDGTAYEAPIDGAGNKIYPEADLNQLFS